MPQGVTVRVAEPSDRDSILTAVREAFARGGRDGQEEVDIVVNTWKLGAAVEGLELVAVDGGSLVGHVLAARGDLGGREAIAVAPLAVLPSHQGRGVGSALMNELLHHAEAAGHPLVALLGNPAYYGRFGFEPSGPFDIWYLPVGKGDPHFQIRRLAAFDPSFKGQFTYCWEAEGGTMATNTAAVIEDYYRSWRGGISSFDESRVTSVLVEDLDFEGPIAGKRRGAGGFIGGLKRFIEGLQGPIDVLQMLDSGDQAAVLYDAALSKGTMRFAEFFRVVDGRIQSIKLLYDAGQYRALGGR
jgi:putative acetyltransferase